MVLSLSLKMIVACELPSLLELAGMLSKLDAHRQICFASEQCARDESLSSRQWPENRGMNSMMYGAESTGSLVWMLLMSILVVIPFWKICSKAGYSGWWSLLMLVPLANLGLLYFLGFATWPVQRQSVETDSI
jgi:hypothetical protein